MISPAARRMDSARESRPEQMMVGRARANGMARAFGLSISRVAIAALLAAGIVVDLVLLEPTLAILRPLVQGGDLILLRGVTAAWMAGGDFYPASQLVPYQYGDGMVLYPPWALALFLPFTVLPEILWWAIPLVIVLGTIWSWRPRPAALMAIAVCAVSYPMLVTVNQGNPTMWMAAFLALGTRWPAYAALVLLKPSLFPFALLGIRHRSWWMVAGLLGTLALVTFPMTLDWIASMTNMRGGGGLLYSLPDALVLAVPILARLGGRKLRRRAAPDVGARREVDDPTADVDHEVDRTLDGTRVIRHPVTDRAEPPNIHGERLVSLARRHVLER